MKRTSVPQKKPRKEKELSTSKPAQENPSDAQETTVESPSGAINTKENSMQANDLLKINVNEHTEKKNGLTYLSWAWAWDQVLRADPSANYEVKTFADSEMNGMLVPYMNLGNSCMVWVTVTIFGKSVTCQLPVLDYRNKCIAAPNAFDINTSIMRCLVKGIALHGLGLYIYAGEDIPMEDGSVTLTVPDTKTAVPAAQVSVDTGDDDANKKLFADGMIEYLKICKDVKGLNSYWKANQVGLDGLKVSHPDLYDQVRNRFAEFKKQFTEATKE
jgi:hypothetical protein